MPPIKRVVKKERDFISSRMLKKKLKQAKRLYEGHKSNQHNVKYFIKAFKENPWLDLSELTKAVISILERLEKLERRLGGQS